ncbi:MAG: hypothetical protein MZV65_47720 [Chromatiales bacterium]|nr:hypothetical protein [Chromatiales bacterium]
MKLTPQTQLPPTPEQIEALEATLRARNACAADWLAGEAFARRTANKIALQKLYHADLRARFGLSAQMAVRRIAQVCEAYKRDKSIRPQFQPFAAMPFDQRLMSFEDRTASRCSHSPGGSSCRFIMGQYQQTRFKAAKGQCDLVRRQDGRWFLLVTVDLLGRHAAAESPTSSGSIWA